MKRITGIFIVLLIPMIMFGQGNHHFLTGNRLDAAGKRLEAIQSYQKSIEAGQMVWQSWNNIGMCYKTLGRYADAESSVKEAITLMPKSAKLYASLGTVYEAWKQYDDARTAYQKACDLGSRSAVVSLRKLDRTRPR